MRRYRTALLILAMLCFPAAIRTGAGKAPKVTCPTTAADSTPAGVRVYTAKKAGCTMYMDGILDEAAWKNAESVGDFVFPWYESGLKEQTEAKIVWDDERVYFAFTCEDRHVWAETCIHGGPVFKDDCCEAFVSPVADGSERTDYINYEFNCIGTWNIGYHARSRGVNLGDWTDVKHIEIGRFINGTANDDSDTDGGWVLEVAVPFEHFTDFAADFPPKNGQVIWVGLNRCGGRTDEQYSQWSPSKTDKPSFHVPEDFGKVIFSTEVLK